MTDKRWWLGALALLLVVAGTVTALGLWAGDDRGRRTVDVRLGSDAPSTNRDEPERLRVHVDNSGSRISVSVRTARRPWQDSLSVRLNGVRTVVRRGEQVARKCGPEVRAVPSSLLTRLTWVRSCVSDPRTVRAVVRVDGGDPVRVRAQQRRRPNVLLIMVDDMRADELRWMPNVRRLIGGQGVTFRNAFAGFPLCCPARASHLNGQHTHNHGVWSHEPPWGFTALRDERLLPVWLQGGGYTTTYLGKYLNGYGNDPEPGTDSGTSTQYVPPGWDIWRASIDGGLPPGHAYDGGTYRFYDTTLNDDGDGYVSLQGQYQSRAYARLTRDLLDDLAADDAPFFSYVSFTAPHHGGPREPDDPDGIVTPARPRPLWGAFDEHITEAPGADWRDPDRSDKPKSVRGTLSRETLRKVREAARQRAEALYVVDQSVKQIVDKLRDTGELARTLVVFTSDNGYFQGEQGRAQGKILPYEPSLRVPLVMRGPGLPKGEVRTDPFLSIDFAPTFADLADVRPGLPVDGRSLLDVARLGDESAGRGWSRVVLTETNPIGSVQQRVAAEDPVGAQPDEMLLGRVTGLRTSRYLYTELQPEPDDPRPGILVELYDVRKDPDQYHNLAVDPAYDDLVARLSAVLADARTCVARECSSMLLPRSLR